MSVNLLVLDASTAVAEALRQRGLALLSHEGLELFMSEQAWSETLHELKRHARVIAERRGLLPEEQEALLVGSVATLEACLQIMPTEAYASLEATACARIPADPNDWPTVALALALGTGVWTQDRDFFGSGLATWSTPVLYHHLMVEQS